MSKINWEEQYKKECKDLREIISVMADCLLMMDANEAHECKFDDELYDKAMELAGLLRSKGDE